MYRNVLRFVVIRFYFKLEVSSDVLLLQNFVDHKNIVLFDPATQLSRKHFVKVFTLTENKQDITG